MADDVADPGATCDRCATRRKLAAFTPAFRGWVSYLLDLYDRRRAGWRVGNDDLTLDQWRALARITDYYEFKRAGLLQGMR